MGFAEEQSSQRIMEENAKSAAAHHAVKDHLHSDHKYIGIGSGSTVVHVVNAIVGMGSQFTNAMSFIPTGSQSKALIKAAGLTLCHLNERPMGPDGTPIPLDVAFDGADEVDADLNCIKGGGGCLLQEKLVAVAAKKFIVVGDYRKLSPRLCTRWKAIPIEVLPLAAPDILAKLRNLGSLNPVIRSGLPGKAGECVSDNGMWIIDAPFPPLLLEKESHSDVSTIQSSLCETHHKSPWKVCDLAESLKRLPGVVEVGLFCVSRNSNFEFTQKPQAAYFGMQDGTYKIVHPN